MASNPRSIRGERQEMMNTNSLRLDVSVVDDLRPLLGFSGNKFSEPVARYRYRLDTQVFATRLRL